MNLKDFKSGSVVKLKSESIKMTINFIKENNIASVYYFNPLTNEIIQKELPLCVLALIQ